MMAMSIPYIVAMSGSDTRSRAAINVVMGSTFIISAIIAAVANLSARNERMIPVA